VERLIPFGVLVAALAAAYLFAQGLRTIDTIGMLVSGVVAGGALAAVARRR
jgi:hypothetical protein